MIQFENGEIVEIQYGKIGKIVEIQDGEFVAEITAYGQTFRCSPDSLKNRIKELESQGLDCELEKEMEKQLDAERKLYNAREILSRYFTKS